MFFTGPDTAQKQPTPDLLVNGRTKPGTTIATNQLTPSQMATGGKPLVPGTVAQSQVTTRVPVTNVTQSVVLNPGLTIAAGTVPGATTAATQVQLAAGLNTQILMTPGIPTQGQLGPSVNQGRVMTGVPGQQMVRPGMPVQGQVLASGINVQGQITPGVQMQVQQMTPGVQAQMMGVGVQSMAVAGGQSLLPAGPSQVMASGQPPHIAGVQQGLMTQEVTMRQG